MINMQALLSLLLSYNLGHIMGDDVIYHIKNVYYLVLSVGGHQYVIYTFDKSRTTCTMIVRIDSVYYVYYNNKFKTSFLM